MHKPSLIVNWEVIPLYGEGFLLEYITTKKNDIIRSPKTDRFWYSCQGYIPHRLLPLDFTGKVFLSLTSSSGDQRFYVNDKNKLYLNYRQICKM